MSLILSLEDLQFERKRWIKDRYHLLATEEYLLLINTNSDFRELTNQLFSGAGELASLLDSLAGMVGGLVTSYSGEKFKDWLSSLSEEKADKKVGEAMRVLEQNAGLQPGMTKILWTDIDLLTYQKGYLFNGPSQFKLHACGEEYHLKAADRSSVQRLVTACKQYAPQARLQRSWRGL